MAVQFYENLTVRPDISTEPRGILDQAIQDMLFNLEDVYDGIPSQIEWTQANHFFKDYYLPLDSQGNLPGLESRPGESVSSHEQRILEFCLQSRENDRLMIIHGNPGVGKTSLLKKVFFHWYPRNMEIQREFIPIYIHVRDAMVQESDGTPADSGQILTNIEQEIINNIYPILRNILYRDVKEWEFNQEQHSNEYIESSILDDRPGGIFRFFPNDDQHHEFQMELVTVLVSQKKLKIVLILDDIDSIPHNIVSSLLTSIRYLTGRGIHVIACMGTSTFHMSTDTIRHMSKCELEVTLKPGFVEEILRHRINYVKQNGISNPGALPPRDATAASTGKDVIGLFCAQMTRSASLKMLVDMSNGNIKKALNILSLIRKADMFSDDFFLRAIKSGGKLSKSQRQDYDIGLLCHLLFSNYSRAICQEDERLQAGMINLFTSGDHDHKPWANLIRINLLSLVYKNWKHSSGESQYIHVTQIHTRFIQAFGNMAGQMMFEDSLLTLLQAGLFQALSGKLYQNGEEYPSHIFSDSIKISPVGRFYMENLLHIIEYFYFIKGGILLYDGTLEFYAEMPERIHEPERIFSSVLEELYNFGNYEWECLSMLQSYSHDQRNNYISMRQYRDNFSPFGLTHQSFLTFHEMILNDFEKQAKQVLKNEFTGSHPDVIIKKIRDLDRENQYIRDILLSA